MGISSLEYFAGSSAVAQYDVIGFIDDDIRKQGTFYTLNLPVLGTVEKAAEDMQGPQHRRNRNRNAISNPPSAKTRHSGMRRNQNPLPDGAVDDGYCVG